MMTFTCVTEIVCLWAIWLLCNKQSFKLLHAEEKHVIVLASDLRGKTGEDSASITKVQAAIVISSLRWKWSFFWVYNGSHQLIDRYTVTSRQTALWLGRRQRWFAVFHPHRLCKPRENSMLTFLLSSFLYASFIHSIDSMIIMFLDRNFYSLLPLSQGCLNLEFKVPLKLCSWIWPPWCDIHLLDATK